jgi:hypothetical protein
LTESPWQEAGGGDISGAGADESQDMGALLEGQELEYRDLRRGEVIEGLVMGATGTEFSSTSAPSPKV